MLQNVSSPVMENQANTIAMAAHQAAVIQSEVFIPSIDADGRISVPGFAHGLTVETYLPLVHLYTRILEASRILDRYRAQLRYQTNGCNAGQEQKPDQAPLTPLHASSLMPHLMYKREDLTVTRAYKVRGALVGMAKAMENQQYRRFIGVSTGNHALGLLKAAEILKPHSVRIVAPSNTAPWKLSKLEQAFAVLQEKGVQGELLLRGSTFDEARDWVLSNQNSECVGETYLDPYNDPWVVAGQGTLGLELLSQLNPLLEEHLYEAVSIITPVGGGGLLTGTAAAFKMSSAWMPDWRKVQAQFIGMRLADLNAPLGDAIRVGEVAPANVSLIQAMQIPTLWMSNENMEQGVRFVQSDLHETIEGASAGAVYPALSTGLLQPSEKHLVVSILSGANIH